MIQLLFCQLPEGFQALGEKGDFLSEICGRNFERFLTGKDA